MRHRLVAAAGVGGALSAEKVPGPFEGVTIKFITSTIVWSLSRQQEGI